MQEGPDLFGQTRVTWPEIFAWCQRRIGLDPASPRIMGYVQSWDVAGKVAAAKERGEWSDSLAHHAESRTHKEGPR